MQKLAHISSLIIMLLLVLFGGIFAYFHETRLYPEYTKLWEYRRLHPDVMASDDVLRALAVGHDTAMADVLWIRLMQFIGDNIVNGKYLDFTHRILTQVQTLHPRFTRAYEVDLLLLPMISPADGTGTTDKKHTLLTSGLSYYESILPRLCDMKKVETISNMGYGTELWSRTDLKNPCLSGYIPYYMANHYDTDLGDRKKASYYYKIASMQDDAPMASRFLGILAYSTDGNHRDGALSFALLASSAYDQEPYRCQKLAESLVSDLSERRSWTATWIAELEKKEHKLTPPDTSSNPLALAGSSCYDWLERGIKQIYLGYITDRTGSTPDITTSQELVDLGIIDHVPVIQTQSGFTLHKQDGVWKYRAP